MAYGTRAERRRFELEFPRDQFIDKIDLAKFEVIVGSAVEMAYMRSDLFDKRRRLMAQWATYVTTPGAAGRVVPIRAA